MAATGWTWDEVDRLTLPRLGTLNRYWALHPPLHLMAQAFLGIKGEMPGVPRKSATDTFDSFIAAMSGV